MSAFRGPSLDDTVNDTNEDADDDKDAATLSDAAQSTVRDIFTALDKNHDGKLQVPEIKVRSFIRTNERAFPSSVAEAPVSQGTLGSLQKSCWLVPHKQCPDAVLLPFSIHASSTAFLGAAAFEPG